MAKEIFSVVMTHSTRRVPLTAPVAPANGTVTRRAAPSLRAPAETVSQGRDDYCFLLVTVTVAE